MNLLDTGAIIDMLKAKKYRPGAISPLSLIETLRGIENKKRTKIKHLLEESFAVINLDNKIIETYCDLYRKLKKDGTPLPDADLLIAATAMAHNLTLETNDEHFQRLARLGLKIKR
jgi:predicted nucleic acid-binding protein